MIVEMIKRILEKTMNFFCFMGKKCVKVGMYVIMKILKLLTMILSTVQMSHENTKTQQTEKKSGKIGGKMKLDKMNNKRKNIYNNFENLTNEEFDKLLGTEMKMLNIVETDNENINKQTKNETTINKKIRGLTICKSNTINIKNKMQPDVYASDVNRVEAIKMFNIIEISDDERSGKMLQVSVEGMKEKMMLTPNHVAAMDNSQQWYSYNGALSINSDAGKNKRYAVALNNSVVRSGDSAFMMMYQENNEMVGITTMLNHVYKMYINDKLITTVVSIIVPKMLIIGAISGNVLVVGENTYICHAAKIEDSLIEIFAVSINPLVPSITYSGAVELKSDKFEKISNKIRKKMVPSKQYFSTILNFSSMPNGMIIGEITKNTSYLLSHNVRVAPLLPTLSYKDCNFDTPYDIKRDPTLVIFDWEDTDKDIKISMIEKIGKRINIRIHIISLNYKLSDDFKDENESNYNTISFHAPNRYTAVRNFTNIQNIENKSKVVLYHNGSNGCCTYTGLYKALKEKQCAVLLKRQRMDNLVKLANTQLTPIKTEKEDIVDELVKGETNWRYKQSFLDHVDTVLGPIYIGEKKTVVDSQKQSGNLTLPTIRVFTRIITTIVHKMMRIYMKLCRYVNRIIRLIV